MVHRVGVRRPALTPTAREHFAQWSPHLFARPIKTPTLVITNELDFRVPVDQGLQMFTVLRRNGVPSRALVFPDEGHWVLKANNSRAWHEAVFGWMRNTWPLPERRAYFLVTRTPPLDVRTRIGAPPEPSCITASRRLRPVTAPGTSMLRPPLLVWASSCAE